MDFGIPFHRFLPVLKGVGAPPEQAGSIPHETDNYILTEKRKPCQPKKLGKQGSCSESRALI